MSEDLKRTAIVGFAIVVCVLAISAAFVGMKRAEASTTPTIVQAPVERNPVDIFFDALWQVETGRKLGPTLGDDGASLGPLQISEAYFKDAKEYGKFEGTYDLWPRCRISEPSHPGT